MSTSCSRKPDRSKDEFSQATGHVPMSLMARSSVRYSRSRPGLPSAGDRRNRERHASSTAAALRAKAVDTVATDDVLAVLKPIWTTKAETASRVRGRIEKVLDAAKAKGFREGENRARWRGHLDHLLPRPSKLARGHHAAMPYDDVAAFIAKLRKREALAALALELCILTAARSGEAGNAMVRTRS